MNNIISWVLMYTAGALFLSVILSLFNMWQYSYVSFWWTFKIAFPVYWVGMMILLAFIIWLGANT